MGWLKSVWAFLKKWWSLFALVIGGIFGVLLFVKRERTFADERKQINETHEEALRKINVIREEERAQHLANQQRLKDTLADIERQYNESKKQLDAKKKAEVTKIFNEHKNDPDALARRLSQATGLKVVDTN